MQRSEAEKPLVEGTKKGSEQSENGQWGEKQVTEAGIAMGTLPVKFFKQQP